MLELTPEECAALEVNVTKELCAASQQDGYTALYKAITQAAVRATIATIREYERMKGTD